MSAFDVSFEVWNNGSLAASRFDALRERVHTLCNELSKVAKLWREARGRYGEEFPAWSYGDSKFPASVRGFLATRKLARRVRKVQRTEYFAGTRMTRGANISDLESVARDVGKLEAVISDLAERVAKAKGEYDRRLAGIEMREKISKMAKAKGEYDRHLAGIEMREKISKMCTSLQAASQLQAADTEAAVSPVEAEAEQAQREERDLRRYAEEVSGLLETVAAEVAPQDRTAIEQRAQEAVQSPSSRRRALLAQLRLDIQRANKAGKARQREVQQAEQWRERLLGLEGPEVEGLDAALGRVVDGQEPLPPDMGQQVEDVVARATEASNREYALGVITEELENLGYVVEVGFETASAQAPEMLLHKPDMEDDYHVSLRVEPGALHNRVVREASDPSEQSAKRERTDEQMERTWCEDLAAALAAAEHRGIRGRAVTRNPPGEVPVPTIAPLKSKPKPKSKRKRKRTGQLKSRVGR